MGIRACCVKQEPEEERNLQKQQPKIEYELDENHTKIENGAYFSEKTTDKINEVNTNVFNNKFFKREEDLLNEDKIKKIQKNFRNFNNKNKFENEIKPQIIEETQSFINELYEQCSKGGELPLCDDFNLEGWKKYYPPNERFFLYQKGKVFPNQIRIKNLNSKNNLEIYEGEVNIDNLKHGLVY